MLRESVFAMLAALPATPSSCTHLGPASQHALICCACCARCALQDDFQREYCGWAECTVPWLEGWIRGHLNESRALGKPFILEEFGMAYSGV
jgi:hypothetical protein